MLPWKQHNAHVDVHTSGLCGSDTTGKLNWWSRLSGFYWLVAGQWRICWPCSHVVWHRWCVSAHRCTTHAPPNYNDREIFLMVIITSGAKHSRTILDPSDNLACFVFCLFRKDCQGFLTRGGGGGQEIPV